MDRHIEVKEISEKNINPDFCFKTVISGDSKVGKTSIINYELLGSHEEDTTENKIFQYYWKNYEVLGKILRLQIWDMTGNETYEVFMKDFYHLSTCVFVVFSLDNINSFKNVRKWIDQIDLGEAPPLIVLVGNKTDKEEERKISREEAEEFCKNNDIEIYYETSAISGYGVHELFIEVIKQLTNKYLEPILYSDDDSRLPGNSRENFCDDRNQNLRKYNPIVDEYNNPCEKCVCSCQ